MIFLVITSYYLFLAVRNRLRYSHLTFFGVSLTFLGIGHDILVSAGIIKPPYISEVSVLISVVIMAIILADKNKRNYDKYKGMVGKFRTSAELEREAKEVQQNYARNLEKRLRKRQGILKA